MRPSSRPASFIMDLTLASSVMSQCRAKARTPRLARSTTVCWASRAECAKSDGDIGAGLGESEGGGASETLGGAGDEAGFAAQRLVWDLYAELSLWRGCGTHGGILPCSAILFIF